jgi:hypothetical protein
MGHMLSRYLFFLMTLLAAVAVACGAPGVEGQPSMERESASSPVELRLQASINQTCPRSGRPVVADSLALYRGKVVGFCNQHCRDDFAAHVDQRPDDRSFFDAILDR